MIPDEHPSQPFPFDHEGDQRRGRGEVFGSLVDHVPDGGVFDPNRPPHPSQRAQPMCDVDHIRSRDTGEEILRPARKSNDLMRKCRPEDEKMFLQRGCADVNIGSQKADGFPHGLSLHEGCVGVNSMGFSS